AAPRPEIKPAPEVGDLLPPSLQLSQEVRRCRRGVVVLVAAGCTWDDGVLSCLRLARKHLRPLVLLHAVQSCPLPALEAWPPDVQPLIAACGRPVKYLSQHASEALREVQRRLEEGAATATVTVGLPAAAAAVAPAATRPAKGPSPGGGVGGEGGGGGGQRTGQQQTLAVKLKLSQPQQPQQGCCQRRCEGEDGKGAAPEGAGVQPPAAAAQQQQQQHPEGLLSLAAVQAAVGSALCCRAAQLMGPWVCEQQPQPQQPQPQQQQPQQQQQQQQQQQLSCGKPGTSSNVTGRSQSPGPITSTPVEALTGGSGGLRLGTPAGGAAASMPGATCGCTAAPTQQPYNRGSCSSRNSRVAVLAPGAPPGEGRQAQRCGSEGDREGRASGGQGGCSNSSNSRRGGTSNGTSGTTSSSRCRCVLRCRDARWTTPVAFICAQLEQDLGRSNVSLQAAGVPCPGSLASCKAAAEATALTPHTSPACVHQSALQQVYETGPKSTAATAFPSPLTVRPRPGSCGASEYGSCSISLSPSPVSTAGVNPHMVRQSVPCVDVFASLTALSAEVERPLSPGVVPPGSQDDNGDGPSEPQDCRAAGCSWAPGCARLCQEDAAAAAGVTVVVHFVSPGLTASHACLSEVAAELVAGGRRVVLVADGQCCQQLPGCGPSDMRPDVWKAIKKLWRERLLYVSDYHSSFCALLAQSVTTTPGTTTHQP
ncbi:hypothetical protein Agub_g12639, partial [Astrephomene gubernaculifera]